jgi:hypothetical protein
LGIIHYSLFIIHWALGFEHWALGIGHWASAPAADFALLNWGGDEDEIAAAARKSGGKLSCPL